MKLHCCGTNHICPSGGASPTRSNNLRRFQQRNTLSIRISIFQVQYTLHWADGARSSHSCPSKRNPSEEAKLGSTKNELKAPNLLFDSTFWGDFLYIYIIHFTYIFFLFSFSFFSCESRWGRAPLAPTDQLPLLVRSYLFI